MKTAMQELIYWIENLTDTSVYVIRDKAKDLLEKEKEQIKNAWDKRGSTIVPRYFLEENIDGEQYYNQTYNQNK